MRRLLVIVLIASACGAASHNAEGPVARTLALAAERSHMSRDLLVAIAAVERGMRLPPRRTASRDDHVPIAGYLELRHGRFDSLTRGAEVAGVDEDTLVEDSELATGYVA